MQNNNVIRTRILFDEVTIEPGESALSNSIDLTNITSYGNFSIHVILAGSGGGKLEYLLSNDNITFIVPLSSIPIYTSFTVGSDLRAFFPEFAAYMKLKWTNVHETEDIIVTTTLAVQ